ncbi:NAD-dependent epimerase/dehydratase family protein [Mucilaginibacter sp. L3T2-6]|uniref:NAD-dependent epimerase/dehydratase family protein n=1 Tax=Mucilaginibacter sp. L3T2-6 TaxID=3062491 RepID=UPI0026761ADD|nr:NAD-dependent epimerase/dehydratase family protein [Mucilaginibacter sp. L3T2-6]MDO3644675.1 NAD-dependent epimerase/dehydratase family protein [Mucilaginibacter sp. L3T2-6]MDV6217127.1 NAD-dependent epimerase/dehydratase family protein [Mucilaginibacter sp. L3T2-6]
MHTILGAGGAVANALTRELINNNDTVRLVSRKPVEPGSKNVTWQKADLLNYDELIAAARGSSVIYLTAGLVYDKKIWAEQWPVIMQNFIRLGKETGARLIFFDNVYMYGLVDGPMKEDTPYRPSSVKGGIRAKIANMLMDEAKAGNIRATIARGADFYGTDNMNSFFDMMVLDKFAKKQKAQWIGNPNKLHNFSYIPDMGKGMFLLGQHPESDNQIWHMPTAKPLTGKQFIELAARIYGAEPKFMAVNKFMLWLVGLFQKVVMGTVEMYYQYNHDYNFNSDKFEKAFNMKPTSYEEGIKALSETLYKKG